MSTGWILGSWLAACSAPAEPPDRTPQIVKPAARRDAWAEARCNDGTAFAYTWRPGLRPTWVINLSGGYFCEDATTPCAGRAPRLTTTVRGADGAAAPRMRTGGVFDPDPAANPTFAAAHHVDAHYCSSDLWLGRSTERRPTSGDPVRGWFFSGARNAEVLFDSLIALQGLDDDDRQTQVLFLGSSAGGAGVVAALDAVIARLPRTAADGRLKVVLDGSFVPRPPWEASLPDAARWGPIHPACPDTSCIYGPAWWPHVAQTGVPVLVQLSALDRTQTPVFGVKSSAQIAAWRDHTITQLRALPWVFSGGSAYHLVATDARFGKGTAGATFREVLDRFWAGAPPEQVFF